jgi:putative ABC transport system permease protein
VINETCARQLGFKNPGEAIGQSIQIGFLGYSSPNKPTGPVIGVVADFHTRSLYEPIGPTFMTASRNFWREILSVRLATRGNGTSYFKGSLSQMEKVWKEVYPGEKFDYTFYDEYLARLYTKEQKTAQIINAAMAISIFISCMGLFGIVTFTAEQRTKELGIRKVLGASIANIVTMLSKDFLKPVGLSILIASPIAWLFMNKWLEGFAYRIPFSWWIFALAGAAALFIALITVSFRTIKAALANPIDSLRSE